MFSSTSYDSNPFPNFPSSSYPTLPFYIDPSEIHDFATNNNNNTTTTNTTLLHDPHSLLVSPFIPHHHHHDAPSLLFPEDTTTLANLAVADCAVAMLDHQDNTSSVYGGLYCGVPNLVCTQKPVAAMAGVKKDRHSKIHTSQGLRDRRVRLSSEIARKFFDLQDMLEFDKPSNTLEWLFTKSENAIKELARSKHSCNNNSSSYCGGDGDKCSCVDPCCDNQHQQQQQQQQSVVLHSGEKSSLFGDSSSSKGRKLKWTQRDQDVCIQTKKESRDKARARARERTCYKMNTNKVQDFEEIMCPVTANNNNAQVLQQLRSSLQMVQQPYPHHQHLLGGGGGGEGHGNSNVIEESIMMIKMNNVKPSSDHNDQQNLVIPNEYYSSSFPYSTPNWDTNEIINGCSNLRGIATMNISTCFMNQWFNQNLWEECTNQIKCDTLIC